MLKKYSGEPLQIWRKGFVLLLWRSLRGKLILPSPQFPMELLMNQMLKLKRMMPQEKNQLMQARSCALSTTLSTMPLLQYSSPRSKDRVSGREDQEGNSSQAKMEKQAVLLLRFWKLIHLSMSSLPVPRGGERRS